MWTSNQRRMCLIQQKVSKRDRLQEAADDAKVLVC